MSTEMYVRVSVSFHSSELDWEMMHHFKAQILLQQQNYEFLESEQKLLRYDRKYEARSFLNFEQCSSTCFNHISF